MKDELVLDAYFSSEALIPEEQNVFPVAYSAYQALCRCFLIIAWKQPFLVHTLLTSPVPAKLAVVRLFGAQIFVAAETLGAWVLKVCRGSQLENLISSIKGHFLRSDINSVSLIGDLL